MTDEEARAKRQLDGWSGGLRYPPGPNGYLYRCHRCQAEMWTHSGARKHENANRAKGCIVLRVDWDDDDYWDFVMAQPGRGE